MPASIDLLKPDRWQGDRRLDPRMTAEEVDKLVQVEPFASILAGEERRRQDGRRLPKYTLREILLNDCRLVRAAPGQILVRRGDYSQSGFLVLKGAVRIDVGGPLHGLRSEVLGRKPSRKRGPLAMLLQLFNPLRSRERAPEERYRRRIEDGKGPEATPSPPTRSFYLDEYSTVFEAGKYRSLQAGAFFGELAALGRCERTATVVAFPEDTDPARPGLGPYAHEDAAVVLLEIRWQGLRDLMDNDGSFRRYVDELFRDRSLRALLERDPLFRGISEEDWHEIIAGVQFETCGDPRWSPKFKKSVRAKGPYAAELVESETVIAAEGHRPHGLVILRNGLGRLTERMDSGERTVGYLLPGQSFGLEELLERQGSGELQTYRYGLRAVGSVNVIVLPVPLVRKLFSGRRIRASTAPPRDDAPAGTVHRSDDAAFAGLDPGLLEFLTGNRFVNGTKTMLIDMERCTRCDDCVRACASTHANNPRFVRHGPRFDRFMVANACMHCMDPVCMIQCPTGAIHRDLETGHVVVNEDTCIGCAFCANNCPYDAIRMTEARDGEGLPLLGAVVDTSTGLPADRVEPIRKATKCDLCVENRGGPACERACPHDALKRVDMRDVPSLARWAAR